MNCRSADRAEKLLCDLIALRTVNPMGRSYAGTQPIERPAVEYLEKLFSPFDILQRRSLCSPIHENLLITIPGRTDAPGTLFESHIDTVPADDWIERAFVSRVSNGRVVGRGACDDKGSLAAMVLAVLELLESGQRPPQTLWLLAAGDEEYGQTGIKHFLAKDSLNIGRGVFGEPTSLLPVIQHKGTIRWDITVRGRSAHTSKAELGHSAIIDIVRVIEALTEHERHLSVNHSNALTGGPSITVTMIDGGRTRNMVPDHCTIAVDFRVVPEMDQQQAIEDLFGRLSGLSLSLEYSEFQCRAPALNTAAEDPFVDCVVKFCQNELGQMLTPAGAPYGSDAGWMPRGIPAIVLGPGNIAQAHAIDEYVDFEQILQGAAIYHHILMHDWSTSNSPRVN